jgi:hypothetical protein
MIKMSDISPKNWSLKACDSAKEAHNIDKANRSDILDQESNKISQKWDI